MVYLSLNEEQKPFSIEAVERFDALLVENNSRARDKIFDSPRNKDLAGSGGFRNAFGKLNGKSAIDITIAIAFSGMYADPRLKTIADRSRDG